MPGGLRLLLDLGTFDGGDRTMLFKLRTGDSMSTVLLLPDGEIYMNALGAGSGGYWSGGGWLYHGWVLRHQLTITLEG